MTKRWEAGQAIILRTVPKNGRVGTALPVTVVQDDAHLVALYLAPGTVCKRRAGKRGGPRGRLLIEDSGRHEDWTWRESRRLFLWRPQEWFAVSLFWREADGAFVGWYVDILEPLRRSPMGFDTRDLVLDIVIAPDRSWRWKDEDELAWFAQNGRLAPHTVESIRSVAERAVSLLEAGDPLWAEAWISWLPDPTWPIPEAPEGWNVVQEG